MESMQESVRMGLVQRAVALAMAFVATSSLFTSVTILFTSAGGGAAQVARSLAGT